MMLKILSRTITLAILALSMHASAESADPTRPLFFKSKQSVQLVKTKPVTKQTPAPVEKLEVYRLTSTLISNKRKIAVINNQVVSVGDKVGKAEVIAIKPAVVHLKSGNKQIVLALAIEKIDKVWKRTSSGIGHGGEQ